MLDLPRHPQDTGRYAMRTHAMRGLPEGPHNTLQRPNQGYMPDMSYAFPSRYVVAKQDSRCIVISATRFDLTVSPDLEFVPRKYHMFINPSIRRVYIDAPEDEVEELKDNVARLESSVASLRRDKARLMDRCESAMAASSKHAEGEKAARQEAQAARKEVENMKRKYEAMKKKYQDLKSQPSEPSTSGEVATTKRNRSQAALDNTLSESPLSSPADSPWDRFAIVNQRRIVRAPKRMRVNGDFFSPTDSAASLPRRVSQPDPPSTLGHRILEDLGHASRPDPPPVFRTTRTYGRSSRVASASAFLERSGNSDMLTAEADESQEDVGDTSRASTSMSSGHGFPPMRFSRTKGARLLDGLSASFSSDDWLEHPNFTVSLDPRTADSLAIDSERIPIKSAASARLSVHGPSNSRMSCAICLEPYSTPIALPCGHVFCQGCIISTIHLSRDRSCATCRRPFPVAALDENIIPPALRPYLLSPFRRLYIDTPSTSSPPSPSCSSAAPTSCMSSRLRLEAENAALRSTCRQLRERVGAQAAANVGLTTFSRVAKDYAAAMREEKFSIQRRYEALKRKYGVDSDDEFADDDASEDEEDRRATSAPAPTESGSRDARSSHALSSGLLTPPIMAPVYSNEAASGTLGPASEASRQHRRLPKRRKVEPSCPAMLIPHASSSSSSSAL
ncbi:hypothetical protein EVG20_g5019 [Dentipellis fragilis]|uniref:RING-type domain-containing protein n=1 Tax=Dentipellis fragilis TaxID=205917 RepID=A0A4Y9YWI2_9AGAM|nr:hypothetical protein EVG20_g5019 [Dentipellis fragilis]